MLKKIALTIVLVALLVGFLALLLHFPSLMVGFFIGSIVFVCFLWASMILDS